MPLHGGEPEGRRVGKVYGLVGPSPSHSRSSLPSLLFPALSLPRVPSFLRIPFSLPVPISLRNLSRINWFDPDVSSHETPIGHRSHAARLVRFVAPFFLLPAPHGTKTTLFLVLPRSQIFAKVTWPWFPESKSSSKRLPRNRFLGPLERITRQTRDPPGSTSEIAWTFDGPRRQLIENWMSPQNKCLLFEMPNWSLISM